MNPWVDALPLTELEELLDPYHDELFGVAISLGIAAGWWEISI